MSLAIGDDIIYTTADSHTTKKIWLVALQNIRYLIIRPNYNNKI